MSEFENEWSVLPEFEAGEDFASGVIKKLDGDWFAGTTANSAARFYEWRRRYYERLVFLSGTASRSIN